MVYIKPVDQLRNRPRKEDGAEKKKFGRLGNKEAAACSGGATRTSVVGFDLSSTYGCETNGMPLVGDFFTWVLWSFRKIPVNLLP